MTKTSASRTVSTLDAGAQRQELLDAVRRGCAQIDGKPWPDVTNRDKERYDAYFDTFINELPLDVAERLVNPSAPTWEQRVRTALEGMFGHTFIEQIPADDNARDFRVIVDKIRRVAERDDVTEVDVLDSINPLTRAEAWLTANPLATIAAHINA